MKLYILSLGCPKNQVDADRFAHALLKAGHSTVPNAPDADVILINTCGFIQSAKEEAIEEIFNAVALKKQNPHLKVMVTGCLAERYQSELASEIPEVDAVVGIGANADIPRLVAEMCAGRRPLQAYGPKTALPLSGPRVISTPSHYAWLKIAEGCSNACAYCAIPAIRGPMRSRAMEDVVDEARWLGEQGVRELVLVAQDVTAYGLDLGQNRLTALLARLEALEGIHWIRLLYAYPEKITPELVHHIAGSAKVLPYFDIPIQHIDDTILTSMRRKGGSEVIRGAIALIREVIPHAVLRTSLIAGYPGETLRQHRALCHFVAETGFDRLGCFAYSPEEGTDAALLPGQVPDEERQRRADAIMETQTAVMLRKQEAMVGKSIEVLCDAWDSEQQAWLCRGATDAPEIDACVLVGAQSLKPGVFARVAITGVSGLDLTGEVIKTEGDKQ